MPVLGTALGGEQLPGVVEIHGLPLEEVADGKVFHAGTKLVGQHVETAGGRVLCACALGNTVADAQRVAYAAVERIHWDGEFHRSDIGWRAIGR